MGQIKLLLQAISFPKVDAVDEACSDVALYRMLIAWLENMKVETGAVRKAATVS